MKKRRTLSVVLSIIFTFCFSLSVLAASNVPTVTGGKTVVFNLNNQSEQIYTYYDAEGNKITMGIKPDDISTRSSEPWSEGTWDIYLYGPLSAFYKIDISASGKITNAYDENYTAIGLSVKSDTLKFTSSQATYKLTYTVPDPLPELLGASGYLIAKISGENLVVTNTIY